MVDEKRLARREEMPKESKWAIEDLYANDELWKEDFIRVQEEMEGLLSYQGRLGSSAKVLWGYLNFKFDLSMKLERVYVYANQKSHEDTGNSVYQDLAAKAQMLTVAYAGKTAFDTPEMIAIPEDQLNEWIKEEDGLKIYRRYLTNTIRMKKHIRSAEVEELLADMGEIAESPNQIFSMFNNADLKFPVIIDGAGKSVMVTHGRFVSLLEDSNVRVRKDAFKALYSMYKGYENTLAASFSANIKTEAFLAKARRYESSLLMALDDSNVPVSVYDNLIETVHNHLPFMHRYVALRKKLLNLDELHMYDLYTPMVGEVDMKISFDEAKRKVLLGLEPLGSNYLNILKEGFEQHWIDVYENEGKRSGAYSWGAYGVHPYVLLNYQDGLKDVFTLAHEMGHALHSYYSDENQPYAYAGYKIFVAEVASTCNEALLMEYLLNHTDNKKEKLYLINYFLEQFRGTLYRQTMFAEFEKITHAMVEKGESLTSLVLCQIYHELNVKYFGDDVVVDDEIDMEWARIPHFYNSFYVYQYATGYSAAIALSRNILKDGTKAVEDYLQFLKGGSSKDAIDLLKGAGIDMTTKEPIEAALSVFEQLLNQMEELCL